MWRPLFLLAAWPLVAVAAVIDFETLTDLEAITSQYPGLTFGNTRALTAGLSLNEFEFPPGSGLNVVFDDGGPLTATFSTPVNSVSAFFTYSVPLIMQAFDVFDNPVASSATIFSSNMGLSGDPGSAPNENLSVGHAAGIYRVSITGAALGGSFTMDDFAFESGAAQAVPEPSFSWLVTIVSGAAMFVARRANATDGSPGRPVNSGKRPC